MLAKPWPWYVAGPIIGLFVPALLLVGNRVFGISSRLRHTCAAIQEMFRFQALHMYGIIGTAVLTAGVSFQMIKRLGARSLDGVPVFVPPKVMARGTRYWLGGICFGLGWALVGACPGPLFVLLGSGIGVISVVLLAAIAGTWTYGSLRPLLPH